MAKSIWPTKIKILTINWDEVQYLLEVSDITDYKLEFITQRLKTIDPIWRTDII